MINGMVGKWIRAFKYGLTNLHDEACSGQPKLINDDLKQKVMKKWKRIDIKFLLHSWVSSSVMKCDVWNFYITFEVLKVIVFLLTKEFMLLENILNEFIAFIYL